MKLYDNMPWIELPDLGRDISDPQNLLILGDIICNFFDAGDAR
jgi:arsenite-transporting ATPase